MRFLIIVALTLSIQLLSLSASGQVKVIGHASAEVVESVSASNSFNQQISVNNNNRIELGSIRLEGASDAACDVKINSATIYNELATYELETGFNESISGNNRRSKDISLSALIDNDVLKGEYDGRLTVIVSYN